MTTPNRRKDNLPPYRDLRVSGKGALWVTGKDGERKLVPFPAYRWKDLVNKAALDEFGDLFPTDPVFRKGYAKGQD